MPMIHEIVLSKERWNLILVSSKWKEADNLMSRKDTIAQQSFIGKDSTKEKLESMYLSVSFYLDISC